MKDSDRQAAIEILQGGGTLSPEWADILFPAQKRECYVAYRGKMREEDILAEAMAVPLQPARLFGNNGADGWRNKLIFGDNLQAMKSLLGMKERGELCNADGTPGARLVYIDPPFGTGDEYKAGNNAAAYSAKMKWGEYLEFLRRRLILLRELLSDNGSIFIRMDYHFGHYIKVAADEIFGAQNFRNEITINRFKRMVRGLSRFNVATDSLLFYTKPGGIFNEQLRKRNCSFCGQAIQAGWRPMHSQGTANNPERKICGKKRLPPRGRHWTYSQEKILELERINRIQINPDIPYTDTAGNYVRGCPEYLQTDEVPVDSDWTDLKGYVFSSRYPTENAEELLERVIRVGSNEGDLVLDAFAGSGTTPAVAEILGRRWVAIDCGKLAIYTMQKRLLNLKRDIGNKGPRRKAKPFMLCNAGLYDIDALRELPREGWRLFALNLFQCKDRPHKIGGIQMDGELRGGSVMVFNHHENPGAHITEETVRDIHGAVGRKAGGRVFIVAPAMAFGFMEDYLEFGGTRYYALRIPYSIIHELHRRDFAAIRQPRDESAVNETVDAVGFDFIRQPELKYGTGPVRGGNEMYDSAFIRITTFKSEALVGNGAARGENLKTLSMLMLDYDYDGKIFQLDDVFYAAALERDGWKARFPKSRIGDRVMAIFVDIYGNEARVVIDASEFNGNGGAKKAVKPGGRKGRKKS